MMKPISRATALILMVAAPVLWSTAGVVTRHVERAQAFEQVFWRSLFAFAFIFAALLLGRRSPVKAVQEAGKAGLLSGALWGLMFTAFVVALSFTSTANTLVVMSIAPLLTAFLARAVLKEPVALRTWAAASVSAIGIAWMAASDSMLAGSRDVAGMLIALTVPVAAATNFVTLRAMALRAASARVDLVPAVMLGGLLSGLIALPLALPFQATGRDLALLAFLGVFQLGLPCMLMVIASRSLQAPEIALLALLEVVLGPLWAWLGAGEVPARATLVGGGIVLAAMVFNELGSKVAIQRNARDAV
jgi:drug/metabolite transporter (DMT)-like permease